MTEEKTETEIGNELVFILSHFYSDSVDRHLTRPEIKNKKRETNKTLYSTITKIVFLTSMRKYDHRVSRLQKCCVKI